MKILIVNGDCLQKNSSANLCHLAYIRGLIAADHEITVLSADGRDYTTDPALVLPDCVTSYTYYGVCLYEKLSLRKVQGDRPNTAPSSSSQNGSAELSIKQRIVRKAKDIVLSMYGVHGIYAKFVRTAQAFRSEVEFDYVLSLSTPVTSHLLTHILLASGHIKAKHWIQIWEDPWYSDAYGFNGKKKIRKEEKRLLSFAEKVCYVSPLTLENQKRLYPESAHKMFWQPLPAYYQRTTTEVVNLTKNQYGYFGDYAPAARDFMPFYQAAIESNIEVNICGNPYDLFSSTKQIHIHPRLPLDELKTFEDQTNVLIFLCNRKGGQIPGKIYQYSATSKTILFILDGTEEEQRVLMDYFGRFNRYVFCENTVEDILRAIRAIEKNELGSVHNEPVEEFNPQRIIQNILMGCER